MINVCKRLTDDYGLSVCVYCIFMNLQHITFTMVAKRWVRGIFWCVYSLIINLRGYLQSVIITINNFLYLLVLILSTSIFMESTLIILFAAWPFIAYWFDRSSVGNKHNYFTVLYFLAATLHWHLFTYV